jgi:peptidoglycan/LPS O-acetylase OafA/YrhL
VRGGTERTTPRLVELDGLRGVSLWLVLAFHICFIAGIDTGRYVPVVSMGTTSSDPGPASLIETVAARGFIGVPIFFALSGFLLAGPFIRWRICGEEPVQVGAFLLRRFSRIQPPYLIALAASMGLIAIGAPVSWWHFVTSALYVHQPIFGSANPALVPAWSLEVEMQWYVAIPLIAVLLSSKDRARRYLTAGALAVIAIWFQATVDASSTRTDATLLSWLQFFIVGWVICDLHQTARSWKPSGVRWDVAAALSWVALFVVAGRWSLEITIGPLLIGSVLIAALHGHVTPALMRFRWLVASGRVSYSAFLLHYPLFLVVRRIAGPGPSTSFPISFLYWTVVLLPITFVIASGFHRWVERPCMDGRIIDWIGESARAAGRRAADLTGIEPATPASSIAELDRVP